MSASTVQRLRSELLQCAICLCPMITPRALPCLHSFCESCLHTHINIHRAQHSSSSIFKQHSSQGYFPCPTCRTETKIPSDGVAMFPKDFRIIKLAESLKTAENDDRTTICGICEVALNDESPTAYCTDCQKPLCDSCTIQHKIKAVLRNHLLLDSNNAIMPCNAKKCSSHPHDRVRFYCDTCNEGICVVCLMKKHDGHFILELELISQSKRLELQQCLEELQGNVWLTHDLLFKVTCGEGRLRTDYEETRLKIRQHIRGLLSKVTADEGKLLVDLEQKYQGRSRELGQQRTKYRSRLEQIETIQNKVDGILRLREPEKLFEAYPDLLSQVKSLCISVTETQKLLYMKPFTSFKPADNNLFVGCLDDTEDECNYSRYSNPFMSDSHSEARPQLFVKSSSSEDNLAAAKRPSSQSPHLRANHGRTLSDSRNEIFRCKKIINTTSNTLNKVNTIEQGHYSGHVSHITHELLFQNNNLCPTVRLLATICGNETRLNLPYDIAFSDNGQLIIADSGNKRILVYDHRGHYKRTIAEGKVSPRSVSTITGGQIIVADEEDKQLKVYSMTGELQQSIKLQHHSSYPYGVAVGKNGNFIVTDMITESVSVISPSGETLLQFGSHGNSITSFDNPVSVTVDDCDNVFVTDSCHHCVKVFNQQGRFLYRIGTYGSGSGQLRYPKAAVIDIYGHVFIADSGNNRIVAYTRTGRYLGVVLSQIQGIVHPTALAASASGLLAVSMTDNDEVRIYEVSHLSRSMLLTVS